MKYIVLIIFYPLVFFVCLWNGLSKYLRVTAINHCTLRAYKKGCKSGIREFIDTHKRIINKYGE